MPVIGVTGGIATGKTAFRHALCIPLEAEVFDADASARELLTHDQDAQRAVLERFGSKVCTEGQIDRVKLRDRVFADPDERRALEGILHPLIRRAWTGRAESIRALPLVRYFIVDIPLLFETHSETHFDRIVVVGASRNTQKDRLTLLRKVPAAVADQMISAQWDLQQKVENSHHVAWNDGTIECLDAQAALMAGYFRKSYG